MVMSHFRPPTLKTTDEEKEAMRKEKLRCESAPHFFFWYNIWYKWSRYTSRSCLGLGPAFSPVSPFLHVTQLQNCRKKCTSLCRWQISDVLFQSPQSVSHCIVATMYRFMARMAASQTKVEPHPISSRWFEAPNLNLRYYYTIIIISLTCWSISGWTIWIWCAFLSPTCHVWFVTSSPSQYNLNKLHECQNRAARLR